MQIRNYFFVFILLFVTGLGSTAQNTMYFMDRMPQKQLYNPALIPNVKFYLALPGLSGISASAYNSGFTYNELDDFLDNLDNAAYNPDEFVNSIGKTNQFISEANANLFSFGFKLKEKGYFAFNYYVKSTLSVDAESDIAYLLSEFDDLSDDDFPLVVDGIDMKHNTYASMGVTYARKMNENLTVGISPSLNFNVLGVKTEGLKYKVQMDQTDPSVDKTYNETFEGTVTLGLPTEINPDAIHGGELDLEEGILPKNWEDDLNAGDFFRNASLSLNLGATYEIHKWMFSASLLNLGGSKWKQNGYLLKGNQDVIKVQKETVKMGIPTQLYLGASRQFSPKWNYALLFNSNFYAGGANSAATLSLNGVVGKTLSTSVSYTSGYKYNNLGVGLRLRFFPGMDFYCVTDNIIQAFSSKNANRLTASVGINLSFGVKEGLTATEKYLDNMEE